MWRRNWGRCLNLYALLFSIVGGLNRCDAVALSNRLRGNRDTGSFDSLSGRVDANGHRCRQRQTRRHDRHSDCTGVDWQGLQDGDLWQWEVALDRQGRDDGLCPLPNLLPLTKDLRNNRLGSLDLEQGMINRMDWDGHSLAIRTKIKVLARRVQALVANSVNSLAAARGVAHSAVLDEVLARLAVDDVIELENLDEAVIGMLLIGDSLARFANVEIRTFDTFLCIC